MRNDINVGSDDENDIIGNVSDGTLGLSLFMGDISSGEVINSGDDGEEGEGVVLPLPRATENGVKVRTAVSDENNGHDVDVKYGTLGGRRDQSTSEFSDVETGGEGIGGEKGDTATALTLPAPWTLLLNLHKKRCRKNSAGSEGSSKEGSITSGSMVTSRRPCPAIDRRFSVGDYVLISNHEMRMNGSSNSNNLVNRFGFPEWNLGMINPPEQRQGPYIYVLAKVVSVHLGEDAQEYTVQREDNMEYQRADAQSMVPLMYQTGIDAAKIAANKKRIIVQNDECTVMGSCSSRVVSTSGDKWNRIRQWMDSMNSVARICRKRLGEVYRKVKQQTDACLNGKRPYGISCRFTGVNLLVVCSIWYIVIDPVRLAFLPSSMDNNIALVSA